MYDVLFWSLFTCNALLAIYLMVSSKMYAQPWRLFALGLISWLMVFWLQEATETIVRLVGEGNAKSLETGIKLLATTVSAMVGAVFGAAISNRAQFLNKKEIQDITKRMENAEVLYRKPAEEIYSKLTDQSLHISREEFRQMVEQKKLLMIEYRLQMSELENELRKLRA